MHEVTGVKQYREEFKVAERKKRVAREQREFIQQREQQLQRERTEQQLMSSSMPETYFKWGQGAANPKRDAQGNILPSKRVVSDVVQHNMERGGGLGRKQKSELSSVIHTELDQLAAQRRQRDTEWRQAELALERHHTTMHDSWQGRGYGGPRRDERTGETHGRFGLDHNEVHHVEKVDRPRGQPKEVKRRYSQGKKKRKDDDDV